MPRSAPLLAVLVALLAAPGPAVAGPVTTGGTHVDPQVTARPADPGRLLAAAADVGTGKPVTRVWRSADGGATWTGGATPPLEQPFVGGEPHARGAPAVTLGDGGGFVALEAAEQAGNGADRPCATASGVYVAETDASGVLSGPARQIVGSSEVFARGRPSVAVDPAFPGRPLLAVAAAPCLPGTGARVEVHYWFPALGGYESTAVPGAEAPVVRTLGAVAYLASLRALPDERAEIEVRACSRSAGSLACPRAGAPRSFRPVTTLRDGLPAGSAPDLAVDPEGFLHLVWTEDAGGRAEVVHARSTDGGVTWTAGPVAGLAGPGAERFLPAVAVAPTPRRDGRRRADVTFLERGPDGATRALQASTDGLRWGQTVPVAGAAPAPLPVVTVHGTSTPGDRLDVVATPAEPGALGGHATALLPRGAGAGLVALRQPHGSTRPVPGGAVVTGKHRPVAVAPVADADGDPVAVDVTPPAHGVLTGWTYTPAPGFAGSDSFVVTADDGYTAAVAAQRPVTVTNATPAVSVDARAHLVAQGTTWRTQLTASDADPGDVLRWSLASAPASLAGRVAVTPDGLLTVELPADLRSVNPLPIGVLVSDTSPQVAGTATGLTYVKVQPVYGAVSVAVGTRATGHTVQFTSALRDLDPEAAVAAARPAPVYLWTFRDPAGRVVATSSLPDPRVRFDSAGGRYAWSLTVTVPRGEGASVTPTVTGVVSLAPDGRTVFAVDQAVDRRRARVTVRLRTRITATVRVSLRLGPRRTLVRRVRLAGGRARSLGPTRAVTFALGRARPRTADLVVTYAEGLAAEPPTPVRRKLRLR